MPRITAAVRLIVLPYHPPLSRRSHSLRQVPPRPSDARDPSSEKWNCVGEKFPVILPNWRLPRHLRNFYMPQIYDMGPTDLLPLRRKACWGFFRPEKSWWLRLGLNPRTWVLNGNTLPLDHRSRKKQSILPEDDRMIEICRSVLSVLM
jgi:hypothetical protein